MKIKTKTPVIILAAFFGALPLIAQTNTYNNGDNHDAAVSDRDQRQTGQMNQSTTGQSQLVTGQNLSNTNNGVDDRDQRQTGQVNQSSAQSAVVVGQPMANTNNGVDDRDQRKNGQMQNPQSSQYAHEGWQHSMDEAQYRFGKLENANDIIGTEVKDSQNEKIGKVKDLAVDLKSGRLVEVIVARGGVLGVDEQFVAVPPSQFTCDAADKNLVLNVSKDQFKSAPSFKLSNWESNMSQSQVSGVYQYYGSRPYFNSDNQSRTNGRYNQMSEHFGEAHRVSKIIGSTVKNNQNEKVGRVENLVVDLAAGRVVEVIVATGGFLHMGGELSAVPPQSFDKGIHNDILTLDRNRQDLTSSPHFKSSDWNTTTNREQVESVYHSYNVMPYFSDTNRVDNTAQNMRDRDHDALTPLKQGNSQADINTTSEIRREIIAVSDLSMNAHNVKIITINGKVTLRGPVNSEDEKRQVGQIAAKVATEANVDNQIQVRNGVTTSSNN